MRTGLIKGADKMEAVVAAANPGSPVFPVTAVYPKRKPNLGTRFNNTPIIRGVNPDKEADTGFLLKTSLASFTAISGLTISPLAVFAYCWTN